MKLRLVPTALILSVAALSSCSSSDSNTETVLTTIAPRPENTDSAISTTTFTAGVAPESTVAPAVAEQIANNLASEIAQMLNQGAKEVTAKQIQDAVVTWTAQKHGEITAEGFESFNFSNTENGASVTVRMSGKDTTAYVCAGPMAAVSKTPC
jgi:hypothetical protein